MRYLRAIFTLISLVMLSPDAYADRVGVSKGENGKSNIRLYKITGPKGGKGCIFGLNGEITVKESEWFKNAYKKNEFCKDDNLNLPTIFWIISSPGGDVQAALEIMEIIRKQRLSTFIWHDKHSLRRGSRPECLSSCALVFSSGLHRHFKKTVESNSHLGIHKPSFVARTYEYIEEERKHDQIKYALIDVMREQGIDPRFVIKMYETKYEEMYFEKLTNLLIWNVITSLDMPVDFPR